MSQLQSGKTGNQAVFFGKNLFTIELSVSDLLELAIWMERNGAEFYRFLAEQSQVREIQLFFLRLMGMELDHERNLRVLLGEEGRKNVGYLGLEEGLTGREFLMMFRKVAKRKIFPGEIDMSVDLDEACNTKAGLKMALEAEKKSVSLYNYLGQFKLYGEAQKVVERLRRDEEGHIRDINEIIHKLDENC